MSIRTRIFNGRVYTPDSTSSTEITFEDRRLVAVGDANGAPASVSLDAEGAFIVPGFVDALVHGGVGAEVMGASLESTHAVARSHGRFGTTAICCGTVASPFEDLCEVLRIVARVVANPPDDGARVLGSHVEGLFGVPEKRGAHPAQHLVPPTIDTFQRLWEASRGTIRILSYPPEADAGLVLTHHLRERCDELGSIVAAMGHTNASYDLARRAVDAGIRRATHLFNGMSGLHHRRVGVIEASLDDPRVHAELICDGVHVHPSWVRAAIRRKTPSQIGLITDAHGAAALPPEDLDRYFERDPDSGLPVARHGLRIFLRDGAAYMHPTEDALGGSTITLRDAVRNAIAWGESIEDALTMATSSPAESLSLPQKGRLDPGFDADVAVFDKDWNPTAVFVEGHALLNELRRVPSS